MLKNTFTWENGCQDGEMSKPSLTASRALQRIKEFLLLLPSGRERDEHDEVNEKLDLFNPLLIGKWIFFTDENGW